MKVLTLKIKTPSDGTFNFLKPVKLYINATDLDDDDLSSINLNTELKDYLKRDSYTLRVETITDQVIIEDHVIGSDAVFRVDAKVLGL